MSLWFISDTHFDHDRIIEYSKRPFFTLEQMNGQLIHNWNSVVNPSDTVYHLGDFAMGNRFDLITEICARLNGFIHLVPGNHDSRKKLEIYANYFTIEPLIVDLRKTNLVLCHYPMAVWPGLGDGKGHLHGHSHGSFQPVGRMMDVGVDAHSMRPVHIDEVRANFSQQVVILRDHHGKGH